MIPPDERSESTDSAPSVLDISDESVYWSDTDVSQSDGSNHPKTIHFLIEIIGATNLCMRDDDLIPNAISWKNCEMQPYCIVKRGFNVLHKTKKAEQLGCNPIWTFATSSIFVLSLPVKELASLNHEKLSFLVMAKQQGVQMIDRTNRSILLGSVQLDYATILSQWCDEKRVEFPLMNEVNEEEGFRGTLALRFRIATKSDIEFTHTLNSKKTKKKIREGSKRHLFAEEAVTKAVLKDRQLASDSAHDDTESEQSQSKRHLFLEEAKTKTTAMTDRQLGILTTEEDETIVAGSSVLNAISSTFRRNSCFDRNTGLTKFRVKPNPDPKQIEATTFMSDHEIKNETRQPSQFWCEVGSGNMGKVYLEVLSCHDLPNMDLGENWGNLTDAFVTAVCEDGVVQTAIIDDELSPRWMPWVKRAFCFNIKHMTSMLYFAVFDYDLGFAHEPIGRVAVNLSHFKQDTVYTLKYNIYNAANVTERTNNGAITVRLRVEVRNEKAAYIAALQPRPKTYVNVEKEKTFRVVRYTCFGEYDNEEDFDVTIMRSYVNEIFGYRRMLNYTVNNSIKSLMFWRGQVRVFVVMLPLHSLLFFCVGAIIVERPYMFPSLLLLSVPWILLARNRISRQHPSPWRRCPSFMHYLRTLLGASPKGRERIDAYEGWEKAEEYEENIKKQLEEKQEFAEKMAEKLQRLQELGDDNIWTQVAGNVIPMDVFVRLGRYQTIMGGILKKMRMVKIILSWEDSILAFWITAVFLVIGLVSLLFPWPLILTWTGRTIIWGLFGPHMKIVDYILTSKYKSTDNKVETSIIFFDRKEKLARMRREEAVKLKAAKCLRFGKFITLVPSFNLVRHYDHPLPESTARPWRKILMAPDLDEASWLPHQQLCGTIIPRPENLAMLNKEESEREKIQIKEQVQSLLKKENFYELSRTSANNRSTVMERSMVMKQSDNKAHTETEYAVVIEQSNVEYKSDKDGVDGSAITSSFFESKTEWLLSKNGVTEEGLEIIAHSLSLTEVGEISAIFQASETMNIAFYR